MIMPQADSPATGFRPFFNPATGEWITYTATAEDNHGQLVRFTWRSVPGGVLTEHVHPHQEERFTILAGQARFTLAGEELMAGAGETIVVPAGVPHSEGNPGPAEIDGIVELRPALHTKEWHEALAGLVADGKTTPRGAPRNPLRESGADNGWAPVGPGGRRTRSGGCMRSSRMAGVTRAGPGSAA